MALRLTADRDLAKKVTAHAANTADARTLLLALGLAVEGSARNQVDGFGNAVSPQVGTWIGNRLRAVLHRAETA